MFVYVLPDANLPVVQENDGLTEVTEIVNWQDTSWAQQLEEATVQIPSLEEQHEMLKNERETLRNELATARKDKEDLERTLRSALKDKEVLEKERETQRDELTTAREDKGELEKRLETALKEKEELEKEWGKRNGILEGRLEAAEGMRQAIEEDWRIESKKTGRLEKELAAAEETLKEHDRAAARGMASLRQQLTALESIPGVRDAKLCLEYLGLGPALLHLITPLKTAAELIRVFQMVRSK